jgi:hypothetical protein
MNKIEQDIFSSDDNKLVNDIIEDIKVVNLKCYSCNNKYEFAKKEIPNVCPNCNYDNWWYKPALERELFILQDEFLKHNKDTKYLIPMYKPLLHYARILLLKKIKNKRVINKDDVIIKVEDTVSKLFIYMSDERKYPNWRVDDSWAGVISNILLDTLYNHKNRFWEQHSSLNQLVKNDKSNNKTELGDVIQGYGYRDTYHIESDVCKNVISKNANIIITVVDLIKEIIEKLKFSKNEKVALYVLVGLKMVLERRKQEIMYDYYSFVGTECETLIKKFTEVIEDYIKMEASEY